MFLNRYLGAAVLRSGPFDEERREAVFRNLLDDDSEGPELVVIPAGSFLMGAAEGCMGSLGRERPQHYCKATDKNEPWGRGTRPVIKVSQDDVSAYAAWLAERTGRSCRLLNEAEWEYSRLGRTCTLQERGYTAD